MYDAEFHVMCSERDQYKNRLINFLKYGIQNCEKTKIRMVFLMQENPFSDIEEIIKQYEKENLHLEVARFDSDAPPHKKCDYFLNIAAHRLNEVRWFIGVDDDSITDVDRLIEHLDEDYDWQEKFYVSTEPMRNIQQAEHDLALLFGKNHWYTPNGGPHHEWEICCMSNKTMKTIFENANSVKAITTRRKMPGGWGDHCLGLIAKFAKIYPVGSNLLSGTHMLSEHKVFDGWILHCHHIYKLPGTNNILPIMNNRQNGPFADRKIFLSELGEEKKEGFYTLTKRGIIIGPPNNRPIGIWNYKETESQLDLHLFDKSNPISFQPEKSDISLETPGLNSFQIITSMA